FLDRAGMHKNVARLLLRVGNAHAHPLAGHYAGVADLTAGLAVERGLIDENRAALALIERGDLLAVLHQRGNDALCLLGLVAQKLARADLLAQREPDGLGRGFARTCPRGARLLTLARHRGVEAIGIDRDAAGPQRVLRQVEREAERVVERERNLALELIARLERAGFLIEDREA